MLARARGARRLDLLPSTRANRHSSRAPDRLWRPTADDECIERLHALLLRVARYEVSRRAGSLQLAGPELDDIAQQACDDALMAIKGKIGDFRGESRFTTWAYRFVMFEVSTKIGRHFWRHRPAALEDGRVGTDPGHARGRG